MVELCELKLLSNCNGGMEEWPPDIDQHVAQLDFAQSTTSIGRSSLFASITLDPSVINSTDSLDMETLRIRCCETNKNDYKLTFEDSGQWTTSGFGGSTTNSPPTPTGRMRSKRLSRQRLYEHGRGPLSKGNLIGLRLLEELNNEEQSDDDDEEDDEDEKRIDNLLNNSPGSGQATMTTWGRIRSTSSAEGPPFEEKTYSLPELNNGARMRSGCLPSDPLKRRPLSDIGLPLPPTPPGSRPMSLVANFVEQQAQRDYSERYLGRYVDINENEIGFVPESTSAVQRADRWRTHHEPGPSSSQPPRPPRTFADLVPSLTAPDLKFLSLAHKVPGFCRSSVSLDDMLRKAAQQGCLAVAAECVGEDPMILEASSTTALHLAENQGGPDSGMGSSSTPSSAGGPVHIEDWTSLSMLLPRHVVDACSFFKQNSSLLSGSSPSSSNNIERKLPRASSAYATPLSHLQRRTSDCCFCDPHSLTNTTTSQILPKNGGKVRRFSGLPARLKTLHAKELAIIGLPIYEAKRDLVERVVEGVAEIRRGASAIVLWSAMERLLSDGLLDGLSAWDVVVEITASPTATGPGPGPGPMGPIHQLVKNIVASEKPLNSRLQHFFKELLEQHSLDGWLTYAVLKERVLGRLYADTAFLLRANSAYRSLFWRLVESLELLSVLNQCQSRIPKVQAQWGSASRIPGDSRVPKSSSVPSKILNVVQRRPSTLALTSPSSSNCSSFKSCSSSRIPVLAGSYRSTPSSPASRPRPQHDTTSLKVVATVREAIAPKLHGRRKRWLPLEAGEKVRILSIRGPWSRCSRLSSRHGLIVNGAVPTHALDLC